MLEEVTLPEEEIVNITFLKRDEFHTVTFKSKEYTVVGGDDVDNLIGVDSHGKVWFLDTENEFTFYASKNLKAFVDQLMLYVKWDHPDDDAPWKVIKANVKKFKCEILKLDMLATFGRNSFWSLIIEQIKEGFL
ncbi:MAG: hypothetical protein K2J77_04160 [Oscillospiraceae bacterium]|nr:hypothetical protein [Oscillospiraceae bacterium]